MFLHQFFKRFSEGWVQSYSSRCTGTLCTEHGGNIIIDSNIFDDTDDINYSFNNDDGNGNKICNNNYGDHKYNNNYDNNGIIMG